MRTITSEKITTAIAKICCDINILLPKDICAALQDSLQTESSLQGKSVLEKLLANAQIARKENIPICQDTGFAIVFAEVGQDLKIKGSLETAINKGIIKGYKPLRKSIVTDPLQRKNTNDNTPAIIYTSLVPGNKLTLHIMAKGGGAENKSAVKMFRPTAEPKEIIDFVKEIVTKADAAACPPLIIGIGIGGTFDYCTYLAKKSLLRKIGSKNKVKYYQGLEKQILTEVNKLNIGPAGYGGSTTALAVHIETYPCHIASLPVAVNIQCHAARHGTIII